MLELARRTDKDRTAIFTSTTLEIGMSEAIVEKDFWVCWMLEILFHHCNYSEYLSFKGGTSLSKGYGIIKRFSEDIDLVLDWRLLGYELREPWNDRSNSAQDRFNKEANKRTENFIKEILMPHLDDLIKKQGVKNYRLYIEESDKQTIRYVYPQLFKDISLVQEIRLEIGSLAAWTPLIDRKITPFVAEHFPQVFSKLHTVIRTVDAKRTFWEKATILHSEAHRVGSLIPQRYSRHYYDLYMLYHSNVKDNAFSDLDLLEKVVLFKKKFYRSNRAKYEEATKNGLKLLPPEENLKDLFDDYDSMQSMIFGEKIPFEQILESLSKMVEELRAL